MNVIKRSVFVCFRLCVEIFLLFYFILLVLIKKSLFLSKRSKLIGIGPTPMINNVYHKQAFERYGYKVETFAINPYYITSQFDVVYIIKRPLDYIKSSISILSKLMKYQLLVLYFDGGFFGIYTLFLWRFEPILYKFAGIKVLVMPYGGDVHDMTRCPNLLYKNALGKDYPEHVKRRTKISKCIDMWTNHADHIISGCDWVYYTPYWHTLTLAHFSIVLPNLSAIKKVGHNNERNGPFKLLHAPNHRNIKGTEYLIKAVNELKNEGYNIELRLLEKVNNEEVLSAIDEADLVIDQLVIGWYAMFAIEAMSRQKAVVCFLDPALLDFYEKSNIVLKDEIPLINADVATVGDVIKSLVNAKNILDDIGLRSRKFVEKYHSVEAIGGIFDSIVKKLDLK